MSEKLQLHNDMTINPNKYRTGKEWVYLVVTIVVSGIYYLWVIADLVKGGKEAALTPFIILGFLALSLFMHLLSMAVVRINSVKVGSNQFPAIWEAMVKLSKRMGLSSPPDMYVLQAGGELNAFAARLVSRRILVIFSDLADTLIEGDNLDQLDAIVAHELAHHALNHTHYYNWFITPAEIIPFLGTTFSRAREYSCDRVMKAVIGSQETCEKALIKLVAGKSLGNKVNIEEYLNQSKTETGFFVWLSEKISTHPHLPYRILAIKKVT